VLVLSVCVWPLRLVTAYSSYEEEWKPYQGTPEEYQSATGEPIVVESGVLRERLLAYSYPSKGMWFNFTYEYRSDRHDQLGSLGLGFRHNHQIEFKDHETNKWWLWLGLQKIMVKYQDSQYKTPKQVFIKVEKPSGWRVTTKDHIQYDFNSDDKIQTIKNLHNNYYFEYSYYTYGNNELVDKIVDSAGRWIRFYYGTDGLPDYVYFDDDKDTGTNVAADSGELKFVQFSYIINQRLSQVTDESGKTTTYDYHPTIYTALVKKDLPRESGQHYQVNWGIEPDQDLYDPVIFYDHTDMGESGGDYYFSIDFVDRTGTPPNDKTVIIEDSNGHQTEYTYEWSYSGGDPDYAGYFLRKKVYKERLGEHEWKVLRVLKRVWFNYYTDLCTYYRIQDNETDSLADYVIGVLKTYGDDGRGNPQTITVRQLYQAEPISDYEDLTIAYNDDDYITQITDVEGLKRYFEYNTINGLDIVLKETYINSAANKKDRVQCSYYTSGDSINLLRGITDPEGNYTEFTYDSNGLMTEVSPPILGKMTYSYTNTPRIGLPTSVSYPVEDGSTKTVTFTYNNYGQVLTIACPTVPDELARSVVFSYNNAAQLTKLEQKYGTNVVRKIEYEYDPYLKLLTKVLETLSTPQDTQAEFSYDLMGNLTDIWDALDQKTEYTYDGIDRVVTRKIVKTGGDNQWSYTYYPDNKLASVTDPNTKETTYTYGYKPDGLYKKLNVLKEIEYDDSSKTEFTYRKNRQLLTATKSSETVTFAYDSLGRVSSVDGVIGGTPDRDTVEYLYRPNSSLLASLKYNLGSQQQLNYSYNSLNQLTKIADTLNSKITAYTYSALTGNLLKTTLPNGATANYTYDILGRLTRLANMASPDDVLDSYSYRFNDKGLRGRVTYGDGRCTDFAYDSLYRLTKETQKTAQGSTIHQLGYLVDKVGNRTDLKYYYSPYGDNDYNSVSYTYNDCNQLMSLSGTGGDKINVTGTVGDTTSGIESVVVTNTTNSYQVTAQVRGGFFIARGLKLNSHNNYLKAEATDEAGNETTVQNHLVKLRKSFTNGFEYDYDNNGNLKEREDKDDEETTYYYYNLQNRLEFVDYPSGYDVQYFYDALGSKYMAKYGTYSGETLTNIQTNLTTKYVYAGGVVIAELDNSNNLKKEYVRGLSLGGGIGGILYCKDDHSDFYYYHYDGNGNVTSITEDDGDEVAIYEYDAFGNVLTEAGSLANEFKFSTKQADKRGRLIDFGFRWYDPEIGRSTQRDPLGVAGGLNLYAYCDSNPVNFLDRWGLQVLMLTPDVFGVGGGPHRGGKREPGPEPVFDDDYWFPWDPLPKLPSVHHDPYPGLDGGTMVLQPDGSVRSIPDPKPPKPKPKSLTEFWEDVGDWFSETGVPALLKGAALALEKAGERALATVLTTVVAVFEPELERFVIIAGGAAIGAEIANRYFPGSPHATLIGGTVGALATALGIDIAAQVW